MIPCQDLPGQAEGPGWMPFAAATPGPDAPGASAIIQHRRVTLHRITVLLLVSLLAACAYGRPDTIVSPRLDSGITSSNGGGMRVLGDDPNVTITTPVGRAR